MADFSRLVANWHQWARSIGGGPVSVSTDCDDCEILFRSRDYSVHLRYDSNWWVVDTIDDRGQRSDADAKFSTFPLTEKYLIWDWITTARPKLASGSLPGSFMGDGACRRVNARKCLSGRGFLGLRRLKISELEGTP